MMEYNIYCDESCHLEHYRQPIMVIGGMWHGPAYRTGRLIPEEIAIVEGKAQNSKKL